MTPERSHKIAINVVMSLIAAHGVAALFVRRCFSPSMQNATDADTYIGRDLPMRTDRRILGRRSPQQFELHQHPRVRRAQQRVERAGRSRHLAPAHPRHLEAQGALFAKDGPLGPRRHQLHLGRLRPRPHGLADHLDPLRRHLVELPAHPLPLEHGGLRRRHDVVGPGHLPLVPTGAAQAELLGPRAAPDGVAREVVGQPGQPRRDRRAVHGGPLEQAVELPEPQDVRQGQGERARARLDRQERVRPADRVEKRVRVGGRRGRHTRLGNVRTGDADEHGGQCKALTPEGITV